MSTAYITSFSKDERKVIEAYLYSHSKIVLVSKGRGTNIYLIKVSADPGVADVFSLAQYQADRLSSGLHAARAFETAEEAVDHIAQWF